MSLVKRTQQIKDNLTGLTNNPRMPYIWLALITLFAAVLRFYKLGTWSFWIDEIYTINHAFSHFSSLGLILDHIPPQ